jgi:hypothetical protein
VKISEPAWTNTSIKAELKTVREGKEFELHVSVIPPLGPGTLVVPITMHTSLPEMQSSPFRRSPWCSPRSICRRPLSCSRHCRWRKLVNSQWTSEMTPPILSCYRAGHKRYWTHVQLRELQPGRLFTLTSRSAPDLTVQPARKSKRL